jgi:WD40 repeat protein
VSYQGHTDTIRSIEWSTDQGRALSGSHDHTVRLWDLETGRCLRVFEGHTAGVVSAAYSADQRRAISCDWVGDIRVWNL